MKTLTIELSDSDWVFCERLVDEGAYPDVNAVLVAALVALMRANVRERCARTVAELLRGLTDNELAPIASRSLSGEDTLKAVLKAAGAP